mmetsp:Transcript_34035/g.71659  ORF Transcript_34035/g.71659 Transcript_34035/m.71659 type:complete len:313 (+) Transcript_34035:335-1273(+)
MVVPARRLMVPHRRPAPVVHASARGRCRRSSPAAVVRASRTRRVRTHGGTKVPSVRTAVPQRIDGEPEGLRPVRIAGEEVALLREVVVGLVVPARAAVGGRGRSRGVAVQHAVHSLLLRRVVRRHGIIAMVPVVVVGAAPSRRRTRGRSAGGSAARIGRAARAARATATAGTGIARVSLDLGRGAPRSLGLVAGSPGLIGGEDALAKVGRGADVGCHAGGAQCAGILQLSAAVAGGVMLLRRGDWRVVRTVRLAEHHVVAVTVGRTDGHGLQRLLLLRRMHARRELFRPVVHEDGLVGERLRVSKFLRAIAY